MEPEGGFEPPTYHLRGGCSAPELLRRRDGESTNAGRAGRSIPCHHAPMAKAQDVAVMGPVARVMVGTDRSPTATRAVEWAAAFADRFGAALHVVQVILPSSPAATE